MRDLSTAKWSHVTRGVTAPGRCRLGGLAAPPRPGDLVVAGVNRVGGGGRLEDAYGRPVRLRVGDLVVGACGNRYATDSYEGYHRPGPQAHLLTSGGVIGTAVSWHTGCTAPTELTILGALTGADDRPLSLDRFARPAPPPPAVPPRALAVVGSSMNAGKTTTAAGLLTGWARAGLVPGAAKVTGTGSGKDRWAYLDAGARHVTDFLDFGMPSTFGYPVERLLTAMTAMRDALVHDGADAVVLELADGLLQEETRRLTAALPEVCDGVVLAVGDALAARAGVDLLSARGVRVLAVSGLVTAGPLAAREAAAATGLPVLSPARLADGAAVDLLAGPLATAAAGGR
ncbi:DUF1611 domain-containing protein [Streptomyces albireticuli]|uniref:DUF1611 domain-containing protein n=1 Tax=Streptomyces albireticuli TaxID=1940 RepID=A0A2A2D898_9ACTN|nr:DUF1611 domain-containing protein [Streptomyces albireticuli]MCD9194328.1 DUF1611 domain-containing protein [Streptomyces albireticuli]PAU47731.1 DUF1611 domain-containing protein [Streptomyces albireticuli]